MTHDLVRWVLIAILYLQVAGLIVLTFSHRQVFRYRPDFTRWWTHAYAMTIAYSILALTTARALYLHLGDLWTLQTYLVAFGSVAGLVSVAVSFYWVRELMEEEER